MIQAIQETDFIAYIETEASRIDTSVTSAHIRHLAKFSNDLDEAVFYAYATTETINNRYTKLEFTYGGADVYTGNLKLIPAGYYKYELYEVSWIGAVDVASGNAPATETDVLSPVANTKGVVQGLVAIGILYLGEKSGSEEVQYTEYEAPSSTNYIYTGVPVIFNEYSLAFDGVDDYVTCGDSNVFTPNNSGANRGFSLSFWIKLPDPETQRVISKNYYWDSGAYHYEYVITTDFADRMKIVLYGGDSASNSITLRLDSTLSADTWYHIAFAWDLGATNADLIGYINGEAYSAALGNAAWTLIGSWTSVSNTINSLDFAREFSIYGELNLDEIALFDSQLSAAQVTAIYNGGTPTDLSGKSYLLGYWRNGDTAGTSVYPTIEDYSSNSNDGTMTNMAAGDIVTEVP